MKNYNIEVIGKYSNILTLLTVNKDMRNMTVEEFTQFMKDAVKAAQEEYSEIMVEINNQNEKETREWNEKRVWKSWSNDSIFHAYQYYQRIHGTSVLRKRCRRTGL